MSVTILEENQKSLMFAWMINSDKEEALLQSNQVEMVRFRIL